MGVSSQDKVVNQDIGNLHHANYNSFHGAGDRVKDKDAFYWYCVCPLHANFGNMCLRLMFSSATVRFVYPGMWTRNAQVSPVNTNDARTARSRNATPKTGIHTTHRRRLMAHAELRSVTDHERDNRSYQLAASVNCSVNRT